MKIAIYDWGGSVMVWEATDYREEDASMIRVSEIVEVEIPMLPPDVLVPARLAQLDQMEAKLTEEHTKKLATIQDKRKELMALAAPVAA